MKINNFIIIMNCIFSSFVSSAEIMEDCGLESIQIILKKYDIRVSYNDIKHLAGYDVQHGTTMLGIKHASEKLGLPVVATCLTIDQMSRIDCPVIVLVDNNHYLVVHGQSWFGFGTDFIVEDSPKGKRTIPADELEQRWNGEALVYSEHLAREMRKQQEEKKRENHVYGPAVFFDETTGFFGTVSEGEKVKHSFTFTNTGTDTLIIRSRSGCSCSVVTNSGNKIAPGKTGSITIMFDTTGRSGFTSQSTMVQTNDPSNKLVKLVVAGAVARGMKTLPGRLYFGDVPQGKEITREVMVLGDGVSPIAIRRIDAPPEYAIETGAAVSDSVYGNYLPLDIRFNAGEEQRKIDDRIILHMASGKTLDVPVSGQVVGLYKAYPPTVFFNGMGDHRNILTTEITLVPTTDQVPEIRVGELEGLTVQLDQKDNHIWRLSARVDCKDLKTINQSEIAVYTKDTVKPVLVLPVLIVESNDL